MNDYEITFTATSTYRMRKRAENYIEAANFIESLFAKSNYEKRGEYIIRPATGITVIASECRELVPSHWRPIEHAESLECERLLKKTKGETDG